MTFMATIVQISDTHLLADPRARLHGHCPQRNLDAVLRALREEPPPDLLLASGDLVHDESEAGYRRLDRALSALAPRVLALPGNHDDPATMTRAMLHAQVLQSVAIDNWRIVALNSHVPDRAGGRLPASALHELDQQLESDDRFAVIAVHHPPVALGSAWIDALGLANGDDLLRLLDGHAQVRALLFGHAHQSFDRRRGHYRLLCAPSTWRQFRPHSRTFAEDHRPPGYRIVRLGADGTLTSRVVRVPLPPSECVRQAEASTR